MLIDLLMSFSHLRCLGLQWHQAGGGVGQHMKMRGGWGAHGRRAALWIHLVVDQTPLLQEGVDPGAETEQHWVSEHKEVLASASDSPSTSWWRTHLLPGSCGRRWRSGIPGDSGGRCRSWSSCRPGIWKKRTLGLISNSLCTVKLLFMSQLMANVLFTDNIIHLWSFGFVFSIEELWKGSTLNGVNAAGKEIEWKKEILYKKWQESFSFFVTTFDNHWYHKFQLLKNVFHH